MTRDMASLTDPAVAALLDKPNHAVLSTLNKDGSVHTTMVWLNVEGDQVALNSESGRHWPANVERDGRVTLTLLNQQDPYEYVEIKGSAVATTDGAEEHIDTLAQKYINQETYPWRTDKPRVKFHVTPTRIRYVKAG
jgi:PPOX class probable F420-dependent enzyme